MPITNKLLEQIEVDPREFILPPQIREANSGTFAPEILRALAESVAAFQIENVGCRRDLTLLWGFRRVKGALLLGMPATLRATVVEGDLTETDVKVMQWAENVHRADLSDWERFYAADQLVAMNSWNNKELGERLKLKPPEVTKLLSPKKCIEEVVQSLKRGEISLGMCYSISKNPEPEEQRRLLSMAQVGVGRDQIEGQRRARQNGQSSAIRMNQLRIALPSGTSLALKGKDMDMNQVVQSLTDTLSAAKKAAQAGYDCRTWQRMMADKAKGV